MVCNATSTSTWVSTSLFRTTTRCVTRLTPSPRGGRGARHGSVRAARAGRAQGAIGGGTWALTWPLAGRYPAQLLRPVALIVAFCCPLVRGAALDGWRGWLGR